MDRASVRRDAAAWNGAGRITDRSDVARLVEQVNATALTRGASALAAPVRSADASELTAPDIIRVLPVVPELHDIVPWPGGLRRGATIAAIGSTSLLLTLLSSAMRNGAWAAVVGLPTFGALAAAELGIPLGRLALVPAPGPDWPSVVGALIDGVELVIVHAPNATVSIVRALAARARQKSCVLIATTAWPGAELVLEATGRTWSGLGDGHGRLRHQDVTLQATGRGRSAQSRRTTLRLPPPSITGPEPDRRIPPPPPPENRSTRSKKTVDDRDTADAHRFAVRAVFPPPDPWQSLMAQDSRPQYPPRAPQDERPPQEPAFILGRCAWPAQTSVRSLR